jgi:hypothetical protein
VDPVRWWGALTQQFAELATKAVQEAAPERPAAPPGGVAPANKPPARKRTRAR